MSTVTPVVLEIDPADLEDELRSGADVVVLDTRDRDSFAAWRVSGAAVLHNVPEDELAEDPEGLVARIPADARVRVICHAGIGSRRVAAALAGRFAEVAVEGPFDVVQFRREARGCLSYLVIAGDEALVVDPAPDITTYRDEAARRGAVITRIFDTHVHADHVSGARELAAATGALLHLSRAALRRGLRYGSEVASVVDGNRLRLGEESVKVIALPGHTSDMTGLLVGDAALIGGDSLFVDSVARPDLEAGSEHAEDAARELFATLAERIAALPDRTLLLPCHYPGGRLTQPLVASLAEVRERVGELGLGREAFVARVLAQLPPVPTNHLAIIAVNLGEPMAADDIARLEVGVNKCAAKQEWDT